MPVIPAEASDSPRQSVWREHRKMLLFFGGVLLLMILFASWRWALSRQVEAALNEIRARGEPVTFADGLGKLAPMPQPSENAAEFYRRAAEAYHEPTETQRPNLPNLGNYVLPGDTDPLPPNVLAESEKLLAENSESFKLLHQAFAAKGCRYIPEDARYDTWLPMFFLKNLRQDTNLLCLEAIVHAEHNQPVEAVTSLRQAWRIAECLSDGPTVMTHIFRTALRSLVSRALNRVMVRTSLSEDSLRTLINEMGAGQDEQWFSIALIGERVLIADIYSKVSVGSSEELDPNISKRAITLYGMSGLLAMDELNYLAKMRDMIVATRLPMHLRADAINKIELATKDRPLWTNLINKMIIPDFTRMSIYDSRNSAVVRTARLAMAIERHRLAHGGQLPTDLNQLVPAFIERIPDDPFTGKPLIFKALPKGFTVYSVGEDLHDDGGARTNPAGKEFEPGTDIPFTIAR